MQSVVTNTPTRLGRLRPQSLGVNTVECPRCEERGLMSEQRGARSEVRSARGEGRSEFAELSIERQWVSSAHRASHAPSTKHRPRFAPLAPRPSLVRRCAKGCAQGARPLPRPRALAARDPCMRCGPCPKRSAPPQTRARDRRVARPDLPSCTANHPHC
jgi:hypothetical protein